jgi:hypothetical protein
MDIIKLAAGRNMRLGRIDGEIEIRSDIEIFGPGIVAMESPG